MRTDEYAPLALRTESDNFEGIRDRQADKSTIRLLHAALGMVTEAGEFADAIKRHLFYGTKIDPVNLAEELGDQIWYVNLAIDALRQMGANVSWNRIMATNIAKLQARYPEKFKADKAENRDLDAERAALEGRRGK